MRRPVFETKQRLLSLLSAEQFLSGKELAQQLGITRSAIARHVKELSLLGVDIFSVKGKGHKLAQPLDLIEEDKLAHMLQGVRPESAELHVFPMIDSTNQFWLTRKNETIASGSACFAECQTAGRGRRGRQWQSPLGAALYFSMWWRSTSNLSELMGLSVAVGLAVTRWLNRLQVPAQVKWPNDVYVEGQKIAGILVELEAAANGCGQAVIGIGLNVALPSSAAEQIDQAWTQLSDHLPQALSRTELAASLYQALFECLSQFELNGLESAIQDWAHYDYFYNQPIRLLMGQHEIHGICRGVDGHGALLVEGAEGIKSYFGGEISVRGQDATG